MNAAAKKTFGVLSVAALLAVGGFFTLDGLLATDAAATVRVAALLRPDKDAINVVDQGQSGSIDIAMAALKAPGFVVIYDDEEGPGKVLGVSRRLPKGVARDVRVPLSQPPAAGYYYAMLRRDDGDGNFEAEKDAPAQDARGAIVMTRFLASTGE